MFSKIRYRQVLKENFSLFRILTFNSISKIVLTDSLKRKKI